MKKIAFFLSAQTIDKKYSKPALELVRLVVEKGYTFVYGGSDYGLMKEAADVVLSLKGKIVAVTSEEYKHVLRHDCDEVYVGKNVAERRRLFLEKSDAFVALPGGIGTLDEITDILASRKVDFHTKPIAFLNTHGYWNGLITQFERMVSDGFLPRKIDEIMFVSDEPEKILEYLSTALL